MINTKKQPAIERTIGERLATTIKSARDIMRKDKGLNGDLDRLPMLTWIMFLKFLDDSENIREQECLVAGELYRPAIEPPYRWRDWAAKPEGITGPELLSFVNNEDCIRPDGTKGAGLFAYLRGLQPGPNVERREVISTVFQGAVNRMISGYLLRDVINKVNDIHFSSSDEIHVLGRLYEEMLKEMRDAAGDAGEFYTPRPLIQCIVRLVNPQLGETILDPACGTGGFLSEAFMHVRGQCKTVADRSFLQMGTIYGGEAKPLPYMLAQMNLLLHGLENPTIDSLNSLRYKLNEIGEKERFDVIMTNPPFGGEEEKGILGNFPPDMQTTETTLLFLQLIMRRLKKAKHSSRAAVIVPNGALYASGIAGRIRKSLVSHFNLHTILRLPKGVFEPYADIPTNVLFFDNSGPTKDIWFYAHPLPPNRAKLKSPSYSQSEPLRAEEFDPLIEWWQDRKENPHAWLTPIESIIEPECNLDLRNPHALDSDVIQIQALADLITDSSNTLRQNSVLLATDVVKYEDKIHRLPLFKPNEATIGELCDVIKGTSPTQKTNPGPYKFVVTAAERKTADTYQLDAPSVCIPMVSSTGHGHASIHRIHYEEGRYAVANIISALVVKHGVPLNPKFLYYYLWRHKEEKLVSLMRGTANTSLTITKLKDVVILFPPQEEQDVLVNALDSVFGKLSACELAMSSLREALNETTGSVLEKYLSICSEKA